MFLMKAGPNSRQVISGLWFYQTTVSCEHCVHSWNFTAKQTLSPRTQTEENLCTSASTAPMDTHCFLPQYVRYSAVCRKVSDTSTLKTQLTPDEHAFPVLLAQSGQISELTVQGMGPIPKNYRKINLNLMAGLKSKFNAQSHHLTFYLYDFLHLCTKTNVCLPGAKKIKYKIRPRSAVQEYGVGQKLYAQNKSSFLNTVSLEHLKNNNKIQY